MSNVYAPFMSFNKAANIWSELVLEGNMTMFFRQLEMTNDCVAEGCSMVDIWCRRGSFFVDFLFTKDLTLAQKSYIYGVFNNYMSGVLLAWGVSKPTLIDVIEDDRELSNLAYFFHILGTTLHNDYLETSTDFIRLQVENKEAFNEINKEELGIIA